MKLDRYKEFTGNLIKESNENENILDYWVSPEDLSELFEPFRDDEYIITYEQSAFNSYKDFIDKDDSAIVKSDDIHLGYSMDIIPNIKLKGRENLNNEFKHILSELKLDGFEIRIWALDGYIDEENVNFINGSIIIWIPETPNKEIPSDLNLLDDGDIYESISSLTLEIFQPEPIKLKTDKNLAEFYGWKDYKVTKHDNIYFEIDINDLASLFLRSDSRYIDLLTNGLDISDYFYYDYDPGINSLFTYHITNDQKSKISKYILKELGKEEITELIEDCCGENLSDKNEDEIIDFLVNGRTNSLEYICKNRDFDLIDELKNVLRDHEMQAQCDKNEEEMYEEFDRKLEYEEIDFKKEFKESKKFYFIKNKQTGQNEKKWYDDFGWVYKIFYQERWLLDYDRSGYPGEKLETIFHEWMSECYFNVDLDPYYSDYGSVDDKSLKKDFDLIIDRSLED